MNSSGFAGVGRVELGSLLDVHPAGFVLGHWTWYSGSAGSEGSRSTGLISDVAFCSLAGTTRFTKGRDSPQ